ncbi:MAG: cyclic nucleotide-binding/CBS domain-containing protein [Candidatus Hodarchaeota archaeon]
MVDISPNVISDSLISLFRKDQCRRLIRKEINILPESATIKDVLQSFHEKKIDYACLIDENDNLIGIVTERNIVRWVGTTDAVEGALAKTIMRKDFLIMESSESISKLVMTMYNNTFQHIPISEQGKLVGVVSARDFIHYLIDYFAESVYTVLPGQPTQERREGA